MSFCKACGKELLESQGFCGSCGAATEADGGTVAASTDSTIAAPASAPMTANVVAAFAYLAGFITGIIFLVIEPYKNNSFIRFHAYQSIFFNVAWIGLWIVWMVVGFVLGTVTKGLFFLIELPINLALMIGGFCLWAFLMYSAYQKKTFKLPFIGALAAKQAGF
ncbi:MAG TPA: hypothetical protein VE377_20930 [Candidatus Dormibacteraeota bacterium]|nr:hypothetical protein [Candidatus Dormibacteraeota bacterium]